MSRGRTERPVSSALRRGANMILWYRAEQKKGLTCQDEHLIERFLVVNENLLEKIDTNELGAIQVLTAGEINRNLRGRVKRNEAMDVGEEDDMLGEGDF